MILGASILFSVSLASIASLFALKAWEVRRGTRILENWRAEADRFALLCKRMLVHWDSVLSRLPALLTVLSRLIVARLALAFSRLANSAATHADRLADLVSYKHRFERRETRSDFLRRVSDGTKGVTKPLDSAAEK